MPKLRDLSGQEVIKILEIFGFSIIRVKGSHHIMQRVVEGKRQSLNVPVHGRRSLDKGMLRRIFRDASVYVSEDDLRSHFYSD